MEKLVKCPVCDTEGVRTYYTSAGGLCEDHFFCKNCGFGHEMAYSELVEFVDLNRGTKEDVNRKAELFKRNKEKIDKMQIPYYLKEDVRRKVEEQASIICTKSGSDATCLPDDVIDWITNEFIERYSAVYDFNVIPSANDIICFMCNYLQTH